MKKFKIAKFLMKTFEAHSISPENEIGRLSEIFNHPFFFNASKANKKKIMFKSSQGKYNSEIQYPWDHYFGLDIAPLLKGKVALDLGCFTGGRSVAWAERYELKQIYGIDVSKTYLLAAIQFVKLKNIYGKFIEARGEKLPFENEKFDVILSFDTFEHVQNVEQTLEECMRVLKRKGCLFVVFPGFYHPTGHHLSLVTIFPFMHYLFDGQTLIKAYNEIIEERGPGAIWYKRNLPELKDWERCNTINGTTFAQFHYLIKKMKWKVLLKSRKHLGGVGSYTLNKSILRFLFLIFLPFARISILEEFACHRITYILEKP